ncbi:MAG: hypothetical protein GXX96_30825 [Planctomycetaceae bacterium]|nr:hypothetical protein [Planctomycetaceae bacterium]
MTVLFAHSSDMPLGAAADLIVASSGNQTDSGTVLAVLLALAVAIGIVVGVLVLMTRAAHRRRTNSHPGLFSGLCQHHKLDRSRRNLLKALGQAHRVRYPARVFLDPTLFDPKRLPPALRSRQDEILALRQQLFLVEDTPSPLQSSS